MPSFLVFLLFSSACAVQGDVRAEKVSRKSMAARKSMAVSAGLLGAPGDQTTNALSRASQVCTVRPVTLPSLAVDAVPHLR